MGTTAEEYFSLAKQLAEKYPDVFGDPALNRWFTAGRGTSPEQAAFAVVMSNGGKIPSSAKDLKKTLQSTIGRQFPDGLTDDQWSKLNERLDIMIGPLADAEADSARDKLNKFYDSLYDPKTAKSLAGAAGGAADRQMRQRGVQGGLSRLSTERAVADAMLGYKSSVDAQKLSALGMMNSADMSMSQLAENARQFNELQRQRAAAEQAARERQLWSTVGGLYGGLVGTALGGATGNSQLGSSLSKIGSGAAGGIAGYAAGGSTGSGGGGTGSVGGYKNPYSGGSF